MHTIRRNIPIWAAGLGATVAVACFGLRPSRTVADGPATQPGATDLAHLQQQRITDLQQEADLKYQLYSKGLTDFEGVSADNERLLDAEMEYAPANQRVDLLQKELANAKQQENDVNSRVKVGIASHADFLDAQAYPLEIEIKLAQEGVK